MSSRAPQLQRRAPAVLSAFLLALCCASAADAGLLDEASLAPIVEPAAQTAGALTQTVAPVTQGVTPAMQAVVTETAETLTEAAEPVAHAVEPATDAAGGVVESAAAVVAQQQPQSAVEQAVDGAGALVGTATSAVSAAVQPVIQPAPDEAAPPAAGSPSDSLPPAGEPTGTGDPSPGWEPAAHGATTSGGVYGGFVDPLPPGTAFPGVEPVSFPASTGVSPSIGDVAAVSTLAAGAAVPNGPLELPATASIVSRAQPDASGGASSSHWLQLGSSRVDRDDAEMLALEGERGTGTTPGPWSTVGDAGTTAILLALLVVALASLGLAAVPRPGYALVGAHRISPEVRLVLVVLGVAILSGLAAARV